MYSHVLSAEVVGVFLINFILGIIILLLLTNLLIKWHMQFVSNCTNGDDSVISRDSTAVGVAQ